MKKPISNLSVFDDGGQALTEFVIVIPIVLLFFFAILQYFQVFRASQLGNYAAYMAGRVYAVNMYPEGRRVAEEKALDAAALALAPVAHLVPGEAPGFGGSRNSDRSGLAALAEGYVAARYVRLVPQIGGGSLTFSLKQRSQIEVEINYPQPIFIPGLSELWGFVGGGGNIHEDLRSLSEGLSKSGSLPPRVERSLPAVFHLLAPGLAAAILNQVPHFTGHPLRFPYVNVRSKCAMGLEDWGSKNPEYRPRLNPRPSPRPRNTVENSPKSYSQPGDTP